MDECLECVDPIESFKKYDAICLSCTIEQHEINAKSGARCEICLLNGEGISDFNACPKMHIDPAEHYTKDFEIGPGCKNCEQRCQEKAFYIGGKNLCAEHKKAFKNRIIVGMNVASKE
jgi:hypothetical protein